MRIKIRNGTAIFLLILYEEPRLIIFDEILLRTLVERDDRNLCRHRLKERVLRRAEVRRAEQIAEYIHLRKLGTHIAHIIDKAEFLCDAVLLCRSTDRRRIRHIAHKNERDARQMRYTRTVCHKVRMQLRIGLRTNIADDKAAVVLSLRMRTDCRKAARAVHD